MLRTGFQTISNAFRMVYDAILLPGNIRECNYWSFDGVWPLFSLFDAFQYNTWIACERKRHIINQRVVCDGMHTCAPRLATSERSGTFWWRQTACGWWKCSTAFRTSWTSTWSWSSCPEVNPQNPKATFLLFGDFYLNFEWNGSIDQNQLLGLLTFCF